MPAKLKRTLPWLLSLAIVGWLFWTSDLDAVAAALLQADIALLAAGVLVFVVLAFLVDSATHVVLFARLLEPMPLREVLAVKGVSYFLNAINYTAGAAAIAWFVHKKNSSLGFLRTLSTMMWLNFVDIAALFVLLTAGLVFGRELLPESMADQLVWVLAAGWAIVIGALIYWRHGVDFLVLGRLRPWRIFDAFRDAALPDYGVMIAIRTFYVALWVGMQWLMLPTFDIHIDLLTLLVYVPILTFVQIVPASVSGLGAVQAVMIAMYAPLIDAPPEEAAARVLAFSTVVGPSTAIVRICIGYVFLRNVADDLVPTDAELEAARVAEEST